MPSKTLFISDLDGTLLNSDVCVSEYTIKTINSCIDKGILFSCATARTIASVKNILEGINVNAPMVLMNGVTIYDKASKRCIKNNYIGYERARIICDILEKHSINGFMYKIIDDTLSTYYQELDNKALQDFYNQRKNRYYKQFTHVDKFSQTADNNTVYFCLINSREKLLPVTEDLKKIDTIKFEFYKDIYDENSWYLEILDENASKYSAVKFLREYMGYEKIVGFGDNINDIPLFNACDLKIAVANAKPEVKEAADIVLSETNNQNGVANYLLDTIGGAE